MAQGEYSVSLPFAHHSIECCVHINSQACFTPVKGDVTPILDRLMKVVHNFSYDVCSSRNLGGIPTRSERR